MPGKRKRRLPCLRRLARSARWLRKKLARAPRMVRIAASLAVLLAAVALLNIVYQLVRKPTELFVLVGNTFDKEPARSTR